MQTKVTAITISFVLLVLGVLNPGTAWSKQEPLKFILLATEDVHLIYRRFIPVKQYIEQELGVAIKLRVGRNYEAALDTIGQGKCDLAYLDPSAYCEARHKYGLCPLAKVVMNDKSQCRSVFVTRKESPLDVFADIEGTRIAFGNVHSSYSYLMPKAMLQDIGLQLSDFTSVGFLQKEDRVALSVLVGDYQVGALSYDVAKRYIPSGLKVIEKSESLPQYVLCASNLLSQTQIKRIRKVLLQYEPKNYEVLSFAPTSDREYNIVRIILKNITGRDYLFYPERSVKLALLPLYSPIKLNKMFSPLTRYLSRQVGREFRLVIPKDFNEFVRLVAKKRVHFAYQNPYVYHLLANQLDVKPLALTISPEPDIPRDKFRGVIIARKNSSIKELFDLCGQDIMIVSFKSAGGYLFQKNLLETKGIDINEQARLIEGHRHEEVVLSVYRGEVEAGFVREAALQLVKDIVDVGRIKVLARTPYYPNWLFVAVPGTKEELVEKVQKTLVHLDKKDLLDKARINGFILPVPEELIRFQKSIEPSTN